MTEQELQEAQERRSEGDVSPTPAVEPAAYIDLTKEASEVSKDGGHPGLPWVPNGSGRLFLEVHNNKGVFIPARYIQTEVVGGDPMVFGMLGVGYYDYATPAHATPFTGPLEVEVEEGNYVEFSLGQYFNRAMIRGVEMLGDDGLLAELYRIRGHEERERSVIREEQELRKEEHSLQRKLFELGQFKDKLTREKKDVEEHLKRAKVRSRVASLLEDGEDVNKALGDTYNWVLSFRGGVEGPTTPSPRRSSAGVQAGPSPPPTEQVRDTDPVPPPGGASQ